MPWTSILTSSRRSDRGGRSALSCRERRVLRPESNSPLSPKRLAGRKPFLEVAQPDPVLLAVQRVGVRAAGAAPLHLHSEEVAVRQDLDPAADRAGRV